MRSKKIEKYIASIFFLAFLVGCNDSKQLDPNQFNNNSEIEHNKQNEKQTQDKSESKPQKIRRNPEPKLDIANVFWKKEYTLFDLITDEPIFPIQENGKYIYQIYYSSNEDPTPHYGEFTPEQLEGHKYYKFKNKENCIKFCDSK